VPQLKNDVLKSKIIDNSTKPISYHAKAHTSFIKKTIRLMFYGKTIALCCRNYTKSINTFYDKNLSFLQALILNLDIVAQWTVNKTVKHNILEYQLQQDVKI
jgi:hypothetical protein